MTDCEKDLFRDTWVRYLGYANEVGESFRSLVPVKVVRASYALAFAYVLTDTGDKSWKMIRKDGTPRKVLLETGDALLWQTLASVAIPGFVINRRELAVFVFLGFRSQKAKQKLYTFLISVPLPICLSVLVISFPDYLIICVYSQNYMQKNVPKLPPTSRKLLTVGIGLASIPFIVHPIDNAVTFLMNHTYRKWVHV